MLVTKTMLLTHLKMFILLKKQKNLIIQSRLKKYKSPYEILKMAKHTAEMKFSMNISRHRLNYILPLYVSLLYKILYSGVIPQSRLDGYIKPIFKNKGSPDDFFFFFFVVVVVVVV